jgi:hypothetical protein
MNLTAMQLQKVSLDRLVWLELAQRTLLLLGEVMDPLDTQGGNTSGSRRASLLARGLQATERAALHLPPAQKSNELERLPCDSCQLLPP